MSPGGHPRLASDALACDVPRLPSDSRFTGHLNKIMNPNCDTCKYFDKAELHSFGGYCRRYPKRQAVGPEDWCGEHKEQIAAMEISVNRVIEGVKLNHPELRGYLETLNPQRTQVDIPIDIPGTALGALTQYGEALAASAHPDDSMIYREVDAKPLTVAQELAAQHCETIVPARVETHNGVTGLVIGVKRGRGRPRKAK